MPPARRRRVQLMYGNGGGGHKASANALQSALSTIAPDLSVQLVDAATLSGAGPGDWLYNQLLRYNATAAIEILHSATSFILPLATPTLRSVFRSHWCQTPDLAVVVSFVPMLNAVFAETLPSHVKLFTVFTDFSHTPGHPWIQHPRQHIITGTDIAFAQALSHAYLPINFHSASMNVTKSSGMVVHPRFYKSAFKPTENAKEDMIAKLGLIPTFPTYLVLFGGAPPTDLVADIVTLLLDRPSPNQVNVITVCANNTQLYDRLIRRKKQFAHYQSRLHLTRYTKDVPLLMQLSDVLIGKPGPGVVSEAFVSGLPTVLVTGTCESNVMKQERDVLDWVRSKGVGMVARRALDATSITSQQITTMRSRIGSLPKNRAVFEVTDMVLEELNHPARSNKLSSTNSQLNTIPTEMDLGAIDMPNKSTCLSFQPYSKKLDNNQESDASSFSDEDHSESGNSIVSDINTGKNRSSIEHIRVNNKIYSPTTITVMPSKRHTEHEKGQNLPNSRANLSLLKDSKNSNKFK